MTARTSMLGPSPGDAILADLARLHRLCLPRSLVSRLGEEFARRFYDRACRGPDSRVFATWSQDGVLTGALVLVNDPSRFGAGIPRKVILLSAIKHPGSWVTLLRAAISRDLDAQPDAAVILLLFVDPSQRRAGLARALVEAAAAAAQADGKQVMAVLTEDRPGNAALDFYRASGFSPGQRGLILGQALVRLERPIA